MKSIMHEASSIAKAVEQGWLKANKPQEFSIKILEEPQKNFIGMTIKSAKIALFFDEKPLRQESKAELRHEGAARPQRQSRPTNTPIAPREQEPRPSRPQREAAPRQTREAASEQFQNPMNETPARRQYEPQWTPAMVERSREWLTQTLAIAHLSHITFTIEPQNFHLRITLSNHLAEDRDKEKQLLASFAALIIETLKHTFKTGLRGHKIVLTHN